jgi:formylglycine-generating enzyme required for sulfatase activity
VPGEPGWFRARSAAKDPRKPVPAALPRGVYCDAHEDGVYWNAKDRSQLVYVPAGAVALGRTLFYRDALESMEPETARSQGPDRPIEPHAAFFIGRFEVMNEQFERFAAATRFATEAERGVVTARVDDGQGRSSGKHGKATWRSPLGDGRPGDARAPVVQVTAGDALDYLAWAELRLPSEREWECAAAWDGAKTTTYPWGDADPQMGDDYAEICAFDRMEPHLVRVGSHPSGRSPWGAFDMIGNAREWVSDTVRNRHGSIVHVVKGGAFCNMDRGIKRQYRDDESGCGNTTGLRVALAGP